MDQPITRQTVDPDEVRDALAKLDGTTASAVSLLTGMTRDELDEYGGLPE